MITAVVVGILLVARYHFQQEVLNDIRYKTERLINKNQTKREVIERDVKKNYTPFDICTSLGGLYSDCK